MADNFEEIKHEIVAPPSFERHQAKVMRGLSKIIKKELDRETKNAFEVVKQIVDNVEPENSSVVHENIECDGCGMAPLEGTRYKCSVC